MVFAGSRILAARKAKTQPTNTVHAEEAPTEALNPPIAPSVSPATEDGTPDWLKNAESPFGSEDVLSQEVSQSNTDTHTPDWMNDHHEEKTAATPTVAPVVEKTIPVEAPATQADVPDWLKDEGIKTPEVPSPLVDTPVIVETPTVIPETPKTEAPEDDIPEWLRGTETETGTDTAPATEEDIVKSSVTETPAEPIEKKESIPETPVSTLPHEDDIPDWLKGTHEETSTPTTTPEIPQKEETIEQAAPVETPVSTS